jgi:hypothetical protein
VIAHGYGETVFTGSHLHLHQAALLPVGVHDHVVAGLGDDRLQVGDGDRVHSERLRQSAHRVADYCDVLGGRGQGEQ